MMKTSNLPAAHPGVVRGSAVGGGRSPAARAAKIMQREWGRGASTVSGTTRPARGDVRRVQPDLDHFPRPLHNESSFYIRSSTEHVLEFGKRFSIDEDKPRQTATSFCGPVGTQRVFKNGNPSMADPEYTVAVSSLSLPLAPPLSLQSHLSSDCFAGRILFHQSDESMTYFVQGQQRWSP